VPRGWFKAQKSWGKGLGRRLENWDFLYLTAPAGQMPGEWDQAYHYGSGAAGLGLRGAGADGPTVCVAV